MPYNPDLVPRPMPWVDFEKDQPIDISPAVGAFQQRFMRKPQMGAPEHAPMDHTGTLGAPPMEHAPINMPAPEHQMGAPASGAAKGFKSL